MHIITTAYLILHDVTFDKFCFENIVHSRKQNSYKFILLIVNLNV